MKFSHRKKLLVAFMLIFMATAEIGFYMPVTEDEAKILFDLYMSQIAGFDSIGIAMHNLTIALAMFIPGAGFLFGLFTAGETGFAFHVANVIQAGVLPFEIHPSIVLLITPFGILEWIAYGIGMSRSYMLIRKIKKRAELKAMIKPTLIEVGIVSALLMLGGFIEHWMIHSGMGYNAVTGGM